MQHQSYDWVGMMNQAGARQHDLFQQLEKANFEHLLQHYSEKADPYGTLADYMLFGAAAILGRHRQASDAVLAYHGRLNEKTKAATLVFWAEEAIAHQQYATAEAFVGPLMAAFGKDPFLNMLMATCCFHQQNLSKGWAYLNAGLTSAPAYVSLHSLKCQYHLSEGDLDAAKSAAKQLLVHDPVNQVAFNILSRLGPADIDQGLIEQFETHAREEELAPANAAALLFDIGRVYDARGQYDRAFDAVAQANENMKAIPQVAGRRFSADQEYQKFVDACGLYDQLEPNAEETAFTPVFIVGLPRTGSTLLDQALSSHPESVSFGESDIIPSIAKEAEDLLLAGKLSEAQEKIPEWQMAFFERATREYSKKKHEGPFQTGPKFIIDKMLGNSRHLGLIAKLFPNAVFLNSRRNELDVGLSIFFSPLNRTNLYATDLNAIGDFIVLEDRIMTFWQQQGFSVPTVAYENMVEATETTLKQVLSHAGMTWHDDCLKFHEQTRAVHTYSAHQVRKAIYKNSAGRWRNYSKQIAPLQDMLKANVTQQVSYSSDAYGLSEDLGR